MCMLCNMYIIVASIFLKTPILTSDIAHCLEMSNAMISSRFEPVRVFCEYSLCHVVHIM